MKNLFKLADDEVPDNISCIRVKHDMTPEEREREKMLQLEAKQKNEARTDLNFRHVVRGPPWERAVVEVRISKTKQNLRRNTAEKEMTQRKRTETNQLDQAQQQEEQAPEMPPSQTTID